MMKVVMRGSGTSAILKFEEDMQEIFQRNCLRSLLGPRLTIKQAVHKMGLNPTFKGYYRRKIKIARPCQTRTQ